MVLCNFSGACVSELTGLAQCLKSAPIACKVEASVNEFGAEGINYLADSATVAATRTGNTARCTVTIPYSWVLSNATAARLNLTYSLTARKAGTTGLLDRESIGAIASIPVPASGSTTTQTVNSVF
jgi:hypothetical protein